MLNADWGEHRFLGPSLQLRHPDRRGNGYAERSRHVRSPLPHSPGAQARAIPSLTCDYDKLTFVSAKTASRAV